MVLLVGDCLQSYLVPVQQIIVLVKHPLDLLLLIFQVGIDICDEHFISTH